MRPVESNSDRDSAAIKCERTGSGITESLTIVPGNGGGSLSGRRGFGDATPLEKRHIPALPPRPSPLGQEAEQRDDQERPVESPVLEEGEGETSTPKS